MGTDVLAVLRDAHDLLDGYLGDSDEHFDDIEEEREYAPVQVAARLVMQAIQELERKAAL